MYIWYLAMHNTWLYRCTTLNYFKYPQTNANKDKFFYNSISDKPTDAGIQRVCVCERMLNGNWIAASAIFNKVLSDKASYK